MSEKRGLRVEPGTYFRPGQVESLVIGRIMQGCYEYAHMEWSSELPTHNARWPASCPPGHRTCRIFQF